MGLLLIGCVQPVHRRFMLELDFLEVAINTIYSVYRF